MKEYLYNNEKNYAYTKYTKQTKMLSKCLLRKTDTIF